MKKLKDEKYEGFTIGFVKERGLVSAYLKRAPSHIGSVDKTRSIGVGYTKAVALANAKSTIDDELEGLYRAYNYAPRFGGF